MCGRFSFAPLVKIIEHRFDVKVNTLKYRPSYNCAPSQALAVISNEHPHELSFYKWGLIPFWAKDPRIAFKLINAKAETIDQKASFKNSFRRKRCLVLSDGFYEWKKINTKEKQAFYIQLAEKQLFSMAGIWDTWKDADGKAIYTFSIITIQANEVMKNIHHRMPVILGKESERIWLEEEDPIRLKSLLKPFDEEEMMAVPVSNKVNSPANNGEELTYPVQTNGQLF